MQITNKQNKRYSSVFRETQRTRKLASISGAEEMAQWARELLISKQKDMSSNSLTSSAANIGLT